MGSRSVKFRTVLSCTYANIDSQNGNPDRYLQVTLFRTKINSLFVFSSQQRKIVALSMLMIKFARQVCIIFLEYVVALFSLSSMC